MYTRSILLVVSSVAAVVFAGTSNTTLSVGHQLEDSPIVVYFPPLGAPNGWFVTPGGVSTTTKGATATFSLQAVSVKISTSSSDNARYSVQEDIRPSKLSTDNGPDFSFPVINNLPHVFILSNLEDSQIITIRSFAYTECIPEEGDPGCFRTLDLGTTTGSPLDPLLRPLIGGLIGGVAFVVIMILLWRRRRRIQKRKSTQSSQPFNSIWSSLRDTESGQTTTTSSLPTFIIPQMPNTPPASDIKFATPAPIFNEKVAVRPISRITTNTTITTSSCIRESSGYRSMSDDTSIDFGRPPLSPVTSSIDFGRPPVSPATTDFGRPPVSPATTDFGQPPVSPASTIEFGRLPLSPITTLDFGPPPLSPVASTTSSKTSTRALIRSTEPKVSWYLVDDTGGVVYKSAPADGESGSRPASPDSAVGRAY